MKKNSAHAYNGALYIENVKNVIHFFVHFSYSCTATSVGIRFSALLGVWEIAGEGEKKVFYFGAIFFQILILNKNIAFYC